MFSVDKSLVRLKLHYLLHGMGGSPVVPFGSLIGRQLGVNPASMGVVFALMPFAGLVLKPLLGGIADKYGAKKRVLMLVIFSAMVNYSLLPLLPSIPTSSTSLLSCSESGRLGSSSLQIRTTDPCLPMRLATLFTNQSLECTASCELSTSPLLISLQPGLVFPTKSSLLLPVVSECTIGSQLCSQLECPNSPQLAHILNNQGDEESSGSQLATSQLWLFILILVLASLSFGCGCTFQESICHEVLGKEAEEKYGQQRLWASLGWVTINCVNFCHFSPV